MLNLVRADPNQFEQVGAGRYLLNLSQDGRLIVGGCSSGAALVRDGRGRGRYRRGCGGSLVRCGRGAGQG